MAGDITRSTFHRAKHYSGMRMQQGRVQMDADWNEQLDIRTYLDETTNVDVIGPCGAPEGDAGFGITADGGNLLIGKGRMYVDGILCENDIDALLAQPQPAADLAHSPSVVSWAANRLDAFAIGSDGDLYHEWWDGGSWGGPENLGGGNFASSPSAVSWAANRLDIFTIGADGNLYHKWWDGGAWGGPENLGGGNLTGSPSAASWAANRLDVFAIGSDGNLYHKWWDGGWGGPENLGGGNLTGSPSAVSWAANRIDIFAIGSDGNLYHRWWSGSWGGPENLGGGNLVNSPAAVTWGANRLDVFAIGSDGNLYHKWQDAGPWNGPENLAGGNLLNSPAAVTWGVNRLDAFAIGADGNLYHKWLDAGTWNGPENLGGGDLVNSPSVDSWAANRLDVFAIGSVGDLIHDAWTGSWGGLENLGGGIAQPDLPGLEYPPTGGLSLESILGGIQGFTMPIAAGTYAAYLDVWKRDITALEDPAIREIALGGPDTATRAKTVWQVKLLQLGDLATPQTCPVNWDSLLGPSTGQMEARAQPSPGNNDPCAVPAQAGYRRLENQLYRVEAHQGGNATTATFKWSRDNASVTAAWTGQDAANPNNLFVSSLGRDQVLGFAGGQWVELTDDTRELWGIPGSLVQLTKAEVTASGPTLTIAGSVKLSDFPLNPKVRRWDQTGTATGSIALQEDTWLGLESGVEVFFAGGGNYRTGDYWLIPARTATAVSAPTVEWPQDESTPPNPLPLPAAGIEHHYCSLAVLTFNTGIWTLLSDCRKPFPPLTGICAKDVCFDDTICKLAGATNVQQAIDLLCQNQGGGCCEVTVGKGGQFATLEQALHTLLSQGVADICICIVGGDYEFPGFVFDAAGAKGLIRLKISGCGPGATRIHAQKQLQLSGLASFTLRDLVIDTGIVGGANAIGLARCDEVSIENCLLSGEQENAVLLNIQGSRLVRLFHNVFEAFLANSFQGVIAAIGDTGPSSLTALFHSPLWTKFVPAAAVAGKELASLSSTAASALATRISRAVQDLTVRLTYGEMSALSLLADLLNTTPRPPEAIAAALMVLRTAAIKGQPGVAIALDGSLPGTAEGLELVTIEQNQVAGILGVYGTPPATPVFSAGELNALKVRITEIPTVGTAGFLLLAGNDLVRVLPGSVMIKTLQGLPATKLGLTGVFGTTTFTNNVVEGAPSGIVSYHANLASNDFTLAAVLINAFTPTPGGAAVPFSVGTVFADTAIYSGDHARFQKFAANLAAIAASLNDVTRNRASGALLDLGLV